MGLDKPWVAFGQGNNLAGLSYFDGSAWVFANYAQPAVLTSSTPAVLAIDGDTPYTSYFSKGYNGSDSGAALWIYHFAPMQPTNTQEFDSPYPINDYAHGQGQARLVGGRIDQYAAEERSTGRRLHRNAVALRPRAGSSRKTRRRPESVAGFRPSEVFFVEQKGIEPSTSAMPLRRSPS